VFRKEILVAAFDVLLALVGQLDLASKSRAVEEAHC
jgi:hypothetical protein